MRYEPQHAATLIDLLLCVLPGGWRRCLKAMDRFRETEMKCASQIKVNLTPMDAAEVIQAALRLSLMRLAPTPDVSLYTFDLMYGL